MLYNQVFNTLTSSKYHKLLIVLIFISMCSLIWLKINGPHRWRHAASTLAFLVSSRYWLSTSFNSVYFRLKDTGVFTHWLIVSSMRPSYSCSCSFVGFRNSVTLPHSQSPLSSILVAKFLSKWYSLVMSSVGRSKRGMHRVWDVHAPWSTMPPVSGS